MPLLAPISVGELFDKLSILELKAAALTDRAQRANALREVNERLWQTEDALRQCERDGQFDARFVELARSVYRDNDRRALIKRRINELTGSDIVEEKSYL